VLEDMMHSKKLVEGMTAPASEPILIHAIERTIERTIDRTAERKG